MSVKKTLYGLPDILLAQLLGFSFVYALTTSLNLAFPAAGIFFILLGCILLFTAAFSSKTSTILFVCVLTAALLAFVYLAAFRIGLGKCWAFLDDYFYWLSEFIYTASDINPLFQAVTITALCLVVSLALYFLAVRKFLFLVTLITGVALFTIQWAYAYMSTLVPFYLFLTAILCAYLKHIHMVKSRKTLNEYINTGAFILWTLPVCLIVIFFASIMNINSKPIEWKWLDKKVNSVYNYFNKKFDYEAFDYFSLGSSGFGGRGNLLGGRVKLDSTLVLQVQTPRNVYLRGAVKDVYTGSSWTNSKSDITPIGNKYTALYKDTAEMQEGMKLLTRDKDFLTKYFYKDTVKVIFLNLKTKSLFIPPKTVTFTPPGKMNDFLDANGSLSSDSRLGRGFSYSVSLYNPRVGSPDFATLLKKSSSTLYSDYLQKKGALNISGDYITVGYGFDDRTKNENIVLSTHDNSIAVSQSGEEDANIVDIMRLNDDSKQIYSRYLQLPSNLPQRVRDLALSITMSCSNEYDKVKAIEQYLASKYPYNLDVRSTPPNRDFVDYFLFDLKEGYCSYYASAMAVLARCAGIPSRYVEGYILPPKPAKDTKNTYLVSNAQSHAWAEIYFEGYGWLQFESTSPFRSAFYSDDSISASVSGNFSPAYNDYMEMMRKYRGDTNGAAPVIGDIKTYKFPYYLLVLITFGILILIFILVYSINILKGKLRIYKMLGLPPRECILALYGYFVGILSLQGLGFMAGETPHQYSQRIDRYMFFDSVEFKAITDIFVKCRYSVNDVSENEKQTICSFRKPFISETKGNLGRFRYFLYRCILGRI